MLNDENIDHMIEELDKEDADILEEQQEKGKGLARANAVQS